jgi:ABC-type transporter Mla MlaB component
MGDIKYKVNQPKKGEKSLKVFIGGDLGVNNIENLATKIKQIEKDFSEIEIVVSEVSMFDLASMQLLFSLQKTVEKNKKKIKFKIDLPKETWELLEITGFSKELKKL